MLEVTCAACDKPFLFETKASLAGRRLTEAVKPPESPPEFVYNPVCPACGERTEIILEGRPDGDGP